MLLVLCLNVFAAGEQISFEWNDMTSVVLDKQVFNDSEPITGKVIFTNLDGAPSLGTKIVLHLAQGSYTYPSQLNLNENIFEEKIINMDFVLSMSKKEAAFSLTNPGSGEFRADAYVWVVKSKGAGASNIFYNPVSANFKVEGNKKERAVIDRAQTVFENTVGPIGFPVDAKSKFKGAVVINNPSSVEKNNLTVGIKICEWASAFCENETETKFNVNPIAAQKSGSVEVELIAPEIPSAYEIGITLYNNGAVESIYKNRVIVSGGTAKVRKIVLGGLNDKNYNLDLVIMGSPDHFSYPEFGNFESKLEVYAGNNIIEEKSAKIDLIKTGDIIEQKYALDSKFFTKFCSKIIKNNIIYETECFTVDLNKLLTEYDIQNPKKIEATFSYDEFSKMLTINLKKEKINAQVRIFDPVQNYLKEMVTADKEYSKSIPMEKINLSLVIDDFDSKTQQLIPMNLALSSNDDIIYGDTNDPNANIISQKKCTGIVCSKNTVCTTKTQLTIEGDCCYTKCVESGVNSQNSLEIPLILWVALIVLIVAIVIIYEVIQKKGVKRK